MKKLIICIIFFKILLTTSFGSQSMRKCVLLPIQDTMGGAMAYGVFKELEYYLKESSWCYYKSNSDILDILGNYHKNLKVHLQNREVLKLVADKIGAGALIIVDIVNSTKGVDISIKIVGENGEDVYLSEKAKINSVDTTLIVQAIKNWLAVFERDIPYKGRLTGVLGDQFTLDAGSGMGVRAGNVITISRPTRKKKHPLLKQIIDWDTKTIGRGRIFHVTEFQAQGKVEEYYTNSKLRINDWANIKNKGGELAPSVKYPEGNKFKFGKLGKVGINFNLGKGSESILTDGISSKQIGGLLFGLDAFGSILISRNFWTKLAIGKGFGSFKEQEGTLTKSSHSISTSSTRFTMGYRYLPLGFYYGPQVDGYFGYGKYSYDLETSSADGITAISFYGPMLGVSGSVPIHKLVRINAALDFLIGSGFEEDAKLNGDADSTSSFSLKAGGSYQYGPAFDINAGIMYRSNKASFKSAVAKDIKLSETMIQIGCIFTY